MKKRNFSQLIVIGLVTMITLSSLGGTNQNPTSLGVLDSSKITIFKLRGDPEATKSSNNVLDSNLNPQYAIQQIDTTVLLNETGTKNNGVIQFVENIWDDVLGSDPWAVSTPSIYQDGFIVTNPANVNNSLFVRIGNVEPVNDSSFPEITGGLSAGWEIGFPIPAAYDLINVSFKWRFDAPDGAFDNYTVLSNGVVLDGTYDFQEIRARVRNSDDENKSFWLEGPVSNKNPNGTVFYRVGPEVTLDEQWFSFSRSFSVPQVPATNFTLELGAYLNTREYYNEYFDVWFDDILIMGLNNVTDVQGPVPTSYGLSKADIVTENKFWANFSEGTWASYVKNVTVIYNRTGTQIDTNVNLSLTYVPPSKINNAGYNETHWTELLNVAFGDVIDFYFVMFDEANNSYVTKILSKTIQDDAAPEIISSMDEADPYFIREMGNGTVLIRVNTSDFGDATSKVKITYQVGGEIKSALMIQNGSEYFIKLNVGFGDELKFQIELNDTAGNLNTFENFMITAKTDFVAPIIHSISILPSESTEGRTFVVVNTTDAYGEINQNGVKLIVRSVNSDGITSTLVDILPLIYNSTLDVYTLGSSPFILRYLDDLDYLFTVEVSDLGEPVSNVVNKTEVYTVPDIIAPKVNSIIEEYPYPSVLWIGITVQDRGSGVKSVFLDKKTESGWDRMALKTDDGLLFYLTLQTDVVGSERIEYRVYVVDNIDNDAFSASRVYVTPIFVTTLMGLIATEAVVVTLFVAFFTLIKAVQRRRIRAVRRERFDVALGRSERLAYIGEEAMFGFVGAFGQREGIVSILAWEPSMIGNFYQYLKELSDKANNSVDFIMQLRATDLNTFVDFKIEEIGCTALVYAYPVSTLPQQWLATLTLDQVPQGGGQGVLLLMLLMREKWAEVANTFQEEIAEGIVELKELILTGETKENFLQKAREFRRFISGTVEVLEEIETEVEDISDDIMEDFEADFLQSDEKPPSFDPNDERGRFS
ncbi:MAG: hypothetical protein ACFFE8_06290 [Candidatus Heimdallarchaeota archaeon]